MVLGGDCARRGFAVTNSGSRRARTRPRQQTRRGPSSRALASGELAHEFNSREGLQGSESAETQRRGRFLSAVTFAFERRRARGQRGADGGPRGNSLRVEDTTRAEKERREIARLRSRSRGRGRFGRAAKSTIDEKHMGFDAAVARRSVERSSRVSSSLTTSPRGRTRFERKQSPSLCASPNALTSAVELRPRCANRAQALNTYRARSPCMFAGDSARTTRW